MFCSSQSHVLTFLPLNTELYVFKGRHAHMNDDVVFAQSKNAKVLTNMVYIRINMSLLQCSCLASRFLYFCIHHLFFLDF